MEPKGPRGPGGNSPPPKFLETFEIFPHIYLPKGENTTYYNILPPQILTFQYIAKILKASAGPDENHLNRNIIN